MIFNFCNKKIHIQKDFFRETHSSGNTGLDRRAPILRQLTCALVRERFVYSALDVLYGYKLNFY